MTAPAARRLQGQPERWRRRVDADQAAAAVRWPARTDPVDQLVNLGRAIRSAGVTLGNTLNEVARGPCTIPHDPCPTCGRTYGSPVDATDRCGVCLTGLSLDGHPVHPVQRADGLWVSPITGTECLQLPDGTWTTWHEMPSLGPWTREQQIESTMADRAAGIW